VLDHAGVALRLDSPTPYQVVQRTPKNTAGVRVRGRLGERAKDVKEIEFRLSSESTSDPWRPLAGDIKDGRFEATLEVPAGGWYSLAVRASAKGKPVAESSVDRLGVGEIFVVAGQSNAANHGAEKQSTKTKRVSAFDGHEWQLANDPQPGASGTGGSFLPPFGDAIATQFGVPVGFIVCGVGEMSVREWLPKGATFPTAPTLARHVRKLTDGAWASQGDLYVTFETA
jgi:hypothetical protein